MKAFVIERYGSPDVMKLREVPKPEPGEDRVLVRVRAASVNAYDWHMLLGKPYLARLGEGLRRPKTTIQGVDLAGVVDAVGPGVTDLKPGDEVFGEKTRACAEYVCGPEKLFVRKPANVSLEQAAAIPVGAVTALQALREHGHIQAGQKILINGASGGVGTFAVQLAKHFGAEVTGVCSTTNLALVRSLGADHVIDYTREDFTRSGLTYDLIIDNVGTQSLRALGRVLSPTGTAVLVGMAKGNWIAPIVRMLGAKRLSRPDGQKFGFMLADVTRENLLFLRELVEAGKITPVIDRRYALSEVPDAIRYLETMRARGKVIITI